MDVAGSLYLIMMFDDVTSTFNNMIPLNMLLNMFFLLLFFFKNFFFALTLNKNDSEIFFIVIANEIKSGFTISQMYKFDD